MDEDQSSNWIEFNSRNTYWELAQPVSGSMNSVVSKTDGLPALVELTTKE